VGARWRVREEGDLVKRWGSPRGVKESWEWRVGRRGGGVATLGRGRCTVVERKEKIEKLD